MIRVELKKFFLYRVHIFVFLYGIFLIMWTTLIAEAEDVKVVIPPSPREFKLEQPVESLINFTFEQVDVRAFARLVGETLGRKIVVGDDVEGKLTIISPQVARKDLYRLFVSILGASGYSVVEEGEICRVVALPKRDVPMAPVVGTEEPIPMYGTIVKVFRLQHVSVSELKRLLETKIAGGKAGSVSAVDETNHLVVMDTAENIRRVEKIIGELDKPGLARVTEVVRLQNASAEDVANQLNLAMGDSSSRAELLKRRLPSVPGVPPFDTSGGAIVVPSPHSNSLILVGTASRIAELKRLIELMDVDTPAGRGRLNAIFLKYISAEEAAKNINALLAKTTGKEGISPVARIAIEANTANNALIVDASPGDFETVKKLVEQLDQPVEQVHLEVVIAESTVSTNLDVGIEMAAMDMPSKPGSTVIHGASSLQENADTLMSIIQKGILPRGLSVGAVHGTRIDNEGKLVTAYAGVVNINALLKKGNYTIRSTPSLVAQNNKEASISIVNEIPVLKSTVQAGTGTARDVIQNIDRVDVGIKLKLIPHIITGGLVRLELEPSIEAVIDSGPEGAYSPIIAKRKASTTVTVADGETVVIAGLTREDKTKNVRKVPLLGSIPIVGWLFTRTLEGTERTNVLILVTPRILSTKNTAGDVLQKWQEKTGLK